MKLQAVLKCWYVIGSEATQLGQSWSTGEWYQGHSGRGVYEWEGGGGDTSERGEGAPVRLGEAWSGAPNMLDVGDPIAAVGGLILFSFWRLQQKDAN